jgi:hypothetical protein
LPTYRNRTMMSLFGKYNMNNPTDIPINKLFNECACHIQHKLEIGAVRQLLQFTYQCGWTSLKRLEGLGKTMYNEILNALYNTNFIAFSENKSIIYHPR